MIIESDFEFLFTDSVWMRAQQYARTKRVTYLGVNRAGRNKNEKYFFSVTGSSNNEYTVTIWSDEFDGDIEANCTCPYDRDGYCKHVGAALINGITDEIFTLIDYMGEPVDKPPKELTESRYREGKVKVEPELLIDLSKSQKIDTKPIRTSANRLERIGSSLPDTLFPESADATTKDAAEPARYFLVFIVELNNASYGYGYVYTHDSLKILPGVRYIKKDGTPGRYESYRDSLPLLPLTDSERNILTWLLDTESKGVPFGYVLPHLVRDPTLRIVVKTRRTYAPLEIKVLAHTQVLFGFAGLQNNNEPIFRPGLVFNSSKTEPDSTTSDVDTPVPVASVTYGESGIGVYFYSEVENTIYHTREANLGARHLTRILNTYKTYNVDDIRAIAETLDPVFLTVTPPRGKILVKSTQPALSLYIESRTWGILVHPSFTYGNQTVDVNEAAQLLTDERIDDTLTVHRRDFVSEDSRIKWFRALCGEEIRSFHPYSLQMDIPEFLFRYGEACVDGNVSLFLKGDDKAIKRAGSFNIVATSDIDWLDLKIRIDGHEIAPGDIDLFRGTVSVDGAYQLLDTETLEKLRTLYASGKAGKNSIQLSRFDLATISQIDSLIEADEDLDLTRIRSALTKLERGFEAKQLRRPKRMVGTLRTYQKEGVKWLQFLAEFGFGGILADDMGLGKTIQAITLLAHLEEEGTAGQYLVVAPVSTIPNWIREIERFAPDMRAYPHIGADRPNDSKDFGSYRGVVVTSYHTLQRDIELFESITWSQLILDESQALKNPTSKTHRTVRKLSFDRVLAMSGTPVENNIQELWSVMSILNPGLLGSKTEFLKKFRKPISDGDQTVVDNLRGKLRPFFLRRTKEQVATDLPPKEEVSIDVSLSPIERKFYDALKEKLRDEVRSFLMSDEPFRAANAILTALTKLRQAAIAPVLVGGPNYSSKLDAVIEKLEEGVLEGHKILIFSQYVRILQMLVDRVEKQQWAYRYLDGSIPSSKRKKIIDDFQSNPDVNVFLISLKAGGVGINLTEADYVFLVDPWWNPAVESQAIDRSHRIGQTKPVFAYRFISEDTIEQRILELQESKRELVKNVIGGDTSMFKSLSKDEIIGLFE